MIISIGFYGRKNSMTWKIEGIDDYHMQGISLENQ